jgi:DNA-binding GntR family transcriptional regulator
MASSISSPSVAPQAIGSDRLLRYLWNVAAGSLVDAEEAHQDHEHQDHEPMMDVLEARDVDRSIEMMRRHRIVTVKAVARWKPRERS